MLWKSGTLPNGPSWKQIFLTWIFKPKDSQSRTMLKKPSQKNAFGVRKGINRVVNSVTRMTQRIWVRKLLRKRLTCSSIEDGWFLLPATGTKSGSGTGFNLLLLKVASLLYPWRALVSDVFLLALCSVKYVIMACGFFATQFGMTVSMHWIHPAMKPKSA